MDTWAQRLVAIAILLASVSLLVGTGTYAYKEVATLQTSSFAKKR
jgi:hypothetical protein